MIRSMTGFASVSRDTDGVSAGVTIKSVNHRFLDIQIKAPSSLAGLEGRIKALLQQRLTRGRIEMSLSVDDTTEPVRVVSLNEALVVQVNAVVDAAREKGLVSGALTASDLLRIPHALEIRLAPPADVPDTAAAVVESAVVEAINALVVMRETEGQFLAADLDRRLQTLSVFVDTVEAGAAAGQAAMELRLRERLAAMPSDLQLDPVAVSQEVVRFVARSDVHEEISRMRGHVEHWRGLADGPEPCGRKLDFLVQEMNREINTIGSKAEGLAVTELVVSAKAELERVKEQVQNVE
ncbi:MAG: YicC family protein [Acidobacteria bacterium]|nr:YicC family protein [Acidobacteriota bacterium]